MKDFEEIGAKNQQFNAYRREVNKTGVDHHLNLPLFCMEIRFQISHIPGIQWNTNMTPGEKSKAYYE